MQRRDIPSTLPLAGLPLAGCWFGPCDPDSLPFVLDGAEVLADDLWVSDDPSSAETCEHICTSVALLEEGAGWRGVLAEQDCTHWIDEEALANTDTGGPDRVVGEVSCSGVLVEGPCKGRRPLHHVEQAGSGPNAEGVALATMAHLEAAAVDAFVELERILSANDAPDRFLRGCRRAAADERVHAALLTRLAAARGATAPRPMTTEGPRTLLDVALVNAVEGCVQETWSALEAQVAAGSAADPDLRAAWARIAVDETRHAQLSWDLHAWFYTVLPQHRGPLDAARQAALARLPAFAASAVQGLPARRGLPGRPSNLAAELARRLAA